MEVKTLTVGRLETNCYLLSSAREEGDAEEGLLIDPGGAAKRIAETVLAKKKEGKFELRYIVATHCHWDHIGALDQLKEQLDTPFLIGEGDREVLAQSGVTEREPDELLSEGRSLKLGKDELEVWETPGHSPGSITLAEREKRYIFSGDLIFAGGFGRTDFPGGSTEELRSSLARLIKETRNAAGEVEEDWRIFPGHGSSTLLSDELSNSPFLGNIAEMI